VLAAPADAAPASDLSLSTSLSQDGGGVVLVNGTEVTNGTLSWERCDASGGCAPIDPGADARILPIGSPPAGTTFRATLDLGPGRTPLTATTGPWGGPISATTAPGVDGPLRTGALIRPGAAGWQGGWDDDSDLLQLQACPTTSSAGCVVMSETFYWSRCAGEAAVIAPRHLGWYVRVADRRTGFGTVFPAFAVRSPAALRPWTAGPLTSVASYGPIAKGSGRLATCGVTRAVLQSRETGRRVIGRIECSVTCTLGLTIRQDDIGVSTRRVLGPGRERPITIPRGLRLHGRVVVTVRINGRVKARRTVRLR
jgi:hypothetical protein